MNKYWIDILNFWININHDWFLSICSNLCLVFANQESFISLCHAIASFIHECTMGCAIKFILRCWFHKHWLTKLVNWKKQLPYLCSIKFPFFASEASGNSIACWHIYFRNCYCYVNNAVIKACYSRTDSSCEKLSVLSESFN